MERYYEKDEVLESFIFFEADAMERDIDINYGYITSGEIKLGPNEKASAFVSSNVDYEGNTTYESGILITSYLPEAVIDEI